MIAPLVATIATAPATTAATTTVMTVAAPAVTEIATPVVVIETAAPVTAREVVASRYCFLVISPNLSSVEKMVTSLVSAPMLAVTDLPEDMETATIAPRVIAPAIR